MGVVPGLFGGGLRENTCDKSKLPRCGSCAVENHHAGLGLRKRRLISNKQFPFGMSNSWNATGVATSVCEDISQPDEIFVLTERGSGRGSFTVFRLLFLWSADLI